MRKLWENKVSRRKLLGGAAATGAALPGAARAGPAQGLHAERVGARGGHASTHQGCTAARGTGARSGGSTPRANGFDPHEILRDFDAGTSRGGVREWEIVAKDREIEVAPGVKYAAWTYNGRVPGPTLRAREGERLRIRFINGSSHPHTMHFHGIHRDLSDGIPGIGAGNIEPGGSTVYEFDATPFGLHLYHCHSTPLAEHIAKGLYGVFIIDPEGGPRAGRRARDGHERVRHQLRPLERGLRRQHRRVRVHGRAGPGQARRAGADLPGQRARVRPPQLVPHPRQLLRLLPDRHAPRAARLHRHRDPGPGRARHPRAALPVHRQVHVPRPRLASSRNSGWMGFFEVVED